MKTDNYVTLDAACDAWTAQHTAATADQLIKTALEYWNDAMIGDLTLSHWLADVATWLRSDK